MNNLYYIRNVGCDDETCGLVRISDEDFPKFKRFIENLNRNSTYGCMPRIFVYKIYEDLIRKVNTEDEDDSRDWRWLYLGDDVYELKIDSTFKCYEELEKRRVI